MVGVFCIISMYTHSREKALSFSYGTEALVLDVTMPTSTAHNQTGFIARFNTWDSGLRGYDGSGERRL